jgi:very-short-patch-repair endonuclease
LVYIDQSTVVTTPSKFTRVARTLRKGDTWAEELLWKWLRDRRFSTYKSRRRHPYPPYILDFFCLKAMLNIELDGFQHGSPDQLLQDANRYAWLEARGIEVLRFWNGRLRTEKDVVRDAIWRALQERVPQTMPEYCRPMRVGEKLRGV